MKKKLIIMLAIVALSFLAITTAVAQEDGVCDPLVDPVYKVKWVGEIPPAIPTVYEEDWRCRYPEPKKGKGNGRGKKPPNNGGITNITIDPTSGLTPALYYAFRGFPNPGVKETSGSGNDYLCNAFVAGRVLQPHLYWITWNRPEGGGGLVDVVIRNRFNKEWPHEDSDISGLDEVGRIDITGFTTMPDYPGAGNPFVPGLTYLMPMDMIRATFRSPRANIGVLAVCEYTGSAVLGATYEIQAFER